MPSGPASVTSSLAWLTSVSQNEKLSRPALAVLSPLIPSTATFLASRGSTSSLEVFFGLFQPYAKKTTKAPGILTPPKVWPSVLESSEATVAWRQECPTRSLKLRCKRLQTGQRLAKREALSRKEVSRLALPYTS